jgi:hypothetical protein
MTLTAGLTYRAMIARHLDFNRRTGKKVLKSDLI